MPTGYTAGILDGTIKDFPQFAKLCMKAFGATIMMRDEPLYKEWEPRVPSDYHTKAIDKAKEDLEKSKSMSDEDIMAKAKSEIEKNKDYHSKKILECTSSLKNLNELLIKAKEFVPPTEEHQGIKDFMIDQIEKTISFDADDKYHVEKLLKLDEEFKSLSPKKVRASMVEKANYDLNYHNQENEKEIQRCLESNLWVTQMVEAVEK